ncbi:MAG: hypothetical protein R2838_09385 [Caldilineaceae bacterium]
MPRRSPQMGPSPEGEPAGLRDGAPSTGLGGRDGDKPGSAGVVGSPGRSRRAGRRDIVGLPRTLPGVNPPGNGTAPRQRGWARRRRTRFSGRGGVAPGRHAGAGRRANRRFGTSPGVNLPGWRRRPVNGLGWSATASPVQRAGVAVTRAGDIVHSSQPARG